MGFKTSKDAYMNWPALRRLVLLLPFVLAACSGPVGPSNDKIRLDVEEFVKKFTNGLATVTSLDIKRQVLAEDRVQVQMTASYKMNEDEYRRTAVRVELLKGNPFGAPAAFELRDAMDKARAMNGNTEKFTWIYRPAGNGLWRVADSYSGH